MRLGSIRSGGNGEGINNKSNGKSIRGWRSRSRTRSRSRGRKQRQQLASESHDGTASAGHAFSDGMLCENGEYAYVTSPPPAPKSGLTGNISSLFRTAFKRGISSGERFRRNVESDDSGYHQYHQHQHYQQHEQAHSCNLSLAAVKSQENTAVYSRSDIGAANIKSGSTRFLGAAIATYQKARCSVLEFDGISGNNKNSNLNKKSNYYPTREGLRVDGQSISSRNNSRLFYSNADNDSDSEYSMDERCRSSSVKDKNSGSYVSTNYAESTNRYSRGTGGCNVESMDTSFITNRSRSECSGEFRNNSKPSKESERNQSGIEYNDQNVLSTTILRYRGFSTSIRNLFLDEALVCASMGCFGLILSNRTEYLLQLRNNRRGVKWGRTSSRRTLPSRIVAYALLLTLILIGITFVVWGFGSDSNNDNIFAFNNGSSNKDGSQNYDKSIYDDDHNQNNNLKYNGGDRDFNYNADDNYNDAGNYNENGYSNHATNDDTNMAYDDAKNNYYHDSNGDEENSYYYNNGGRQLDYQMTQSSFKEHQQYRLNGVFKIRDIKKSMWEPAIKFLNNELCPPYAKRQLQNYINDDFNFYDDSSRATTRSLNRDFASDLRTSLIFAFLIVLGILGRRRRMRTRYYLVRARAQEDHLFYASSGAGTKRVGFQDSREDQYEGACSHTLCGCYPTDPPREGDEIEDEVQVNDDGVSHRKKKSHHEDFIGRGFNCLLGLCCGFVCNCWFQCLSICALAQEAREMRLLVPTRFQRLDYITHQPFHEYQKEVNDLRRGWMGKTRKKTGVMPHFNALSRLSRYILVISVLLSTTIAATLFFNPRASFSWPDLIILSATFIQSFLVLWVVHWIFHKSDLSLDAVIKFFTAGFVIAVPSAFFFEGLLVNITLITAVAGYSLGQLVGGESFIEWITQHYRLLWILVEIFNAYIVATVTEELCKYYTFRCVEHPDLIFLTGLSSTTQDERALEGGLVKYPFSSHQVQQSNAKNPYDDDASHYSRSSHRSKGSGKHTVLDPEDSFCEDDQDVRMHRQKAAAVTTAMISVAVGLACAENFLYVFLLGGTGTGVDSDGETTINRYLQEWIVLFFRSIFPVHALAAAMQSVNMIRKFIETGDVNGHRIGVGRIILPAVIMHGTFDAILLGINVFVETSWDDYMEANGGNIDEENPTPYNTFIVNLVAWLSMIFVMMGGIVWYYKENRTQRLRLIEMEDREKAVGSPVYTNPRILHTSGVELV